MKIAICAPDIFEGDAVGNHCVGIARTAARLGYAAHLYAQRFDSGMSSIRPIDRLFDDPAAALAEDDILLVSYSILDVDLDRLLALPCKKICYFHGVTTPALLAEFEPQTASLCAASYAQFDRLAAFDAIISNSESSARSVGDWAKNRIVTIVPPVIEDMPVFAKATRQVCASVLPRLLMVGRVVPHKRIEDGIDVLAALREQGVDAVLRIVGSAPNDQYSTFLINHARAVGVLDNVDFAGVLDAEDLFDEYAKAAALLTTSLHEGFCVPVLEALHFGKPVYVRAGTAAEELCTGDQVLQADAPASVWARRLLDDGVISRSPLDGSGDVLAQDPSRMSYTARYRAQADAVLKRSGLAAWASIFEKIGNASPLGAVPQ